MLIFVSSEMHDWSVQKAAQQETFGAFLAFGESLNKVHGRLRKQLF